MKLKFFSLDCEVQWTTINRLSTQAAVAQEQQALLLGTRRYDVKNKFYCQKSFRRMILLSAKN